MKKINNRVYLEGRLFDSTLEIKTVKNENSANFGKEYIGGVLQIAVDEEGTNCIPVNFTYVVPTTSKGATNRTFNVLKDIIENGKFWSTDGKDEATMVSVSTAFAANDFVSHEGEMVESVRLEGGFVTKIHQLKPESERNVAQVDMIITKLIDIEENEERNITAHTDIKGCTFNFRNELIPITFSVYNPKIIDWLEDQDISSKDPMFIKTFVNIENITKKVEFTEELAFGERVIESERKVKNYIVFNFAKERYDFDDEGTITAAELEKAIQDRQLHLAQVKKDHEDYMNGSDSSAPAAPANSETTTKKRKYDF